MLQIRARTSCRSARFTCFASRATAHRAASARRLALRMAILSVGRSVRCSREPCRMVPPAPAFAAQIAVFVSRMTHLRQHMADLCVIWTRSPCMVHIMSTVSEECRTQCCRAEKRRTYCWSSCF